MTEINEAAMVAQLTQLYLKYEKALCTNDIETLDNLFWDAPQVVRFGVTENLYGGDEVRAFRQGREVVNLDRQMYTAAVTLEFRRVTDGVVRLGRQSQMWRKFPEGWKIVSAHVSLLPV
jgi:hypothetical protein